MTDDELIEQAILGHASTREAMRWLIERVRHDCAQICDEIALYSDPHDFALDAVNHCAAMIRGMGRPGEGND